MANNFTLINPLFNPVSNSPAPILASGAPTNTLKNSLKITNNVVSLSFQSIQAATYSSNLSAISVNGVSGLSTSCIISSNSIVNKYDSASYLVGVYLGENVSGNITDNNISDFTSAGIFCNKLTGDIGNITNNIISRGVRSIFSYISGAADTIGVGGVSPNTSSALVVDNYFDSNSISPIIDHNVVKNRGINWVVERNKNQREVMYLTADCGLAGTDYNGSGEPLIFRVPYGGNTSTSYPTYYFNSQSPQSPAPSSSSTGYFPGSLTSDTSGASNSAGGYLGSATSSSPKTIALFTTNIGTPNKNQVINGVWNVVFTAFADTDISGDSIRFGVNIFTWDNNNVKTTIGSISNNVATLDGYFHEYNFAIPINTTSLTEDQRVGIEIFAYHTSFSLTGNPQFTLYFGGNYNSRLITNISTFKADSISAPINVLQTTNNPILKFYSNNIVLNNKTFYWNINPRKILPNGVKIVGIEQDVEQNLGTISVSNGILLINKYLSNNYYSATKNISFDSLNTKNTLQFTENELGNTLRLGPVINNVYSDTQNVISITLLITILSQSANETLSFSAYPMKLTYEW